MKFELLRLQGFKSFVDASELGIAPGLTGIIGPNGCGKSNLLEALRWVMGETSAKSMRGAGMEDVIFAGTKSRPSRNFAEVVLKIDNSERRAPALFNDHDVLEVSRRIDRDRGSTYRVNGKEVRARDLQILFADAATGPSSASLVRQGQISTLINAKPKARRHVLEEAAGITGLHGRRREAEQRLEAASANLERLEDVIGQREGQVNSLKRQARQAAKYRDLSGDIKRTEAQIFHVRWTSLSTHCSELEDRLEGCRELVETRTRAAAEAAGSQSSAADTLPDLRQAEAEAAARVQRLASERALLEREREELQREQERLRTQIDQAHQGLQRDQALLKDARETLEHLALTANDMGEETGLEARLREAEAADAAASARLQESEAQLEALTKSEAEAGTKRALAEQKASALADQIEARRAQLVDLEEALAAHQSDHQHAQAQPVLESLRPLEDESARAAARFAEAEGALQAASQAERTASERLREAENKLSALRAEAEALTSFLGKAATEPEATASEAPPPAPAILHDIAVPAGLERAVAAAFGEDLQASLDEAAPHHFAGGFDEAADAGLPGTLPSLADHIDGPAAVRRRLLQTGLATVDEAQALHRALKPGQVLVSRDGDLWNWDGLVKRSDAPSLAVKVLEKRNRLSDLESLLQLAASAVQSARLDRVKAEEARKQAEEFVSETRNALRQAREAFEAARKAAEETVRRVDQLSLKIDTLNKQKAEAERDQKRDREERHAQEELVASVGTAAAQTQKAVEAARAAIAPVREAAAEARATRESLKRQIGERLSRLQAIHRDMETWQRRQTEAENGIRRGEQTLKDASVALEALIKAPEEIRAKEEVLLSTLSEAEAAQRAASDAVGEAENRLRDADRGERDAHNALTQARETLARLETETVAASERRQDLLRTIRAALDCTPEALLALADFHEDQELPDELALEKLLERLKRDRDHLGPVNLRAEEELEELAGGLAEMITERDDLLAAVARLNGAIEDLNQEGRQRLITAFETVNTQFQDLFTRLFRGGTAELKLVEDDDPLEAGLEILAKPPGKALQNLSLLSGGEQALTAMALIFAVFRANPAPVCVLDEVDAPLDDANVERFCTLLDELARTTQTRFLVITHHPLSMARMDRLYGVTMAEQGVSQLVSVDLSRYADQKAAE